MEQDTEIPPSILDREEIYVWSRYKESMKMLYSPRTYEIQDLYSTLAANMKVWSYFRTAEIL